jgi:HSP20 family protein
MDWIDNDEFEKMIEKMLKRLGLNSQNRINQENTSDVKSWYYGYSMRIGPDGKPIVREFSNLNPTINPSTWRFHQTGIAEYNEPLTQVDINTEENKVRVLVEMPGVTKDSINVNATETLVKINANHEFRKYLTEVPIEARINPDSADAKYNNGVLELNFELIESQKDEGVDIPIN